MRSKMFKGIAVFVMALLIASTIVYAHGPLGLSPGKELDTYINVNSLGIAVPVAVSTTTVLPAYHRVIGFVVVPYAVGAGSELTLGLYDAATTGALTEANLYDEAEWDDDGNNQPRWYPAPKRLLNGLGFIQGPNTVAIIYLEDTRKF